MCIDYMASPCDRSPAAALQAHRISLAIAEAHLAAGRESVGGASQSYAAATLRRQIATLEAK